MFVYNESNVINLKFKNNIVINTTLGLKCHTASFICHQKSAQKNSNKKIIGKILSSWNQGYYICYILLVSDFINTFLTLNL